MSIKESLERYDKVLKDWQEHQKLSERAARFKRALKYKKQGIKDLGSYRELTAKLWAISRRIKEIERSLAREG